MSAKSFTLLATLPKTSKRQLRNGKAGSKGERHQNSQRTACNVLTCQSNPCCYRNCDTRTVARCQISSGHFLGKIAYTIPSNHKHVHGSRRFRQFSELKGQSIETVCCLNSNLASIQNAEKVEGTPLVKDYLG